MNREHKQDLSLIFRSSYVSSMSSVHQGHINSSVLCCLRLGLVRLVFLCHRRRVAVPCNRRMLTVNKSMGQRFQVCKATVGSICDEYHM